MLCLCLKICSSHLLSFWTDFLFVKTTNTTQIGHYFAKQWICFLERNTVKWAVCLTLCLDFNIAWQLLLKRFFGPAAHMTWHKVRCFILDPVKTAWKEGCVKSFVVTKAMASGCDKPLCSPPCQQCFIIPISKSCPWNFDLGMADFFFYCEHAHAMFITSYRKRFLTRGKQQSHVSTCLEMQRAR